MGARGEWSRVGRVRTQIALALLAAGVLDLACAPSWPEPRVAAPSAMDDARDRVAGRRATSNARIEAQTVCVATRADAAGTLGGSVLYHFRRDGSTLRVGYFVHWTTERPWGANTLTYAVVPALVTDAFYSHFLFVLPGLQRVMYGPGDVEGALVVYEESADGRLQVVRGAAENASHDVVELSADDLVDERGRVVLASDVWSHQLGAGVGRANQAGQELETRCFQGAELAPLTDEVAREFRLGTPEAPRRARVAWQLDPPAGLTR
jgi:hypothetical protein